VAKTSKKPQFGRIAELYGLPLADFTGARNELAKELRGEGDAEGAESAKAARKPTTPAWAVNQLVRREPKRIKELLGLGEELREAQGRLVSGGDAGDVLALSDRERRLVQDLVESAAEILRSDGGKASEATLEDVRETLHAAALDEEAAAEVASGRLLKERQAIGLGFGAGAPASPAAAPKGRRAAPKKAPSASVEKAQRRLEEARAAARDARDFAGEAEDRLAGARKAAEAAARAVKRAEGQARQAAAAAERAEERERKAAENVERAEG
jgi:hypothetical protein